MNTAAKVEMCGAVAKAAAQLAQKMLAKETIPYHKRTRIYLYFFIYAIYIQTHVNANAIFAAASACCMQQ